jgi:hypothetical protein
MKKLITILSVCIACTFAGITQSSAEIDEFTTIFGVETSVGFESEYNDKGRDVADNVVTTNFELDIYNAYVGVDGFWTVDNGSTNKMEAYAGYTLADLLLDGIDVDVGADLNIFPNAGATDENYSIEPFVGLTFSDLIFEPSVYVYYDISYEQLTVEGSISESWVSENVVPFVGPLTLTPSLYAGWSHVGNISPKTTKVSDGYTYVGGAFDVSVNVGDFVVSAGPRYVVSDNAAIDLSDLSWGVLASYRF